MLGALFLSLVPNLSAQDNEPVQILIISDQYEAQKASEDLENGIIDEIGSLFKNRINQEINVLFGEFDLDRMNTQLDEAFNDPDVDLVIGSGVIISALMAQRKSFPKPVIASIIINPILQDVPLSPEGTSGLSNFTYLQTPFDIERDLKQMRRISPYKKVGVLAPEVLGNVFPFISEKFFPDIFGRIGCQYDLIFFKEPAISTIESIDPDIDAVYFLPASQSLTDADEVALLEALNQRKIMSSAIIGDDMVYKGALMGYKAQQNLELIPRRIALTSLKILEGQNASELSVKIPNYTENLMINMLTAKKIGKYPDFDLMSESTLINLNIFDTERTLSLPGAIAEALKNNLSAQISQKDVSLAEKDISIAKSDYLPQADISSTLSLIDENSAANSFGAQGRWNLSAQGNLSQILLSEPVLANIAIQKYLREGQKYALEEVQLDITNDVITAYLNVLQSLTSIRVQQDNVRITRENLDISTAKEAVGYSGATDINRWESELAQNNIELNNLEAQFRQAQFQLNQLLNRPIGEEFNMEEVELEDVPLLATDPRMDELIKDYGRLALLADFLVEEGMRYLPELKQLDYNILATQRNAKSQKRRFYIPNVTLSGTTTIPIDRYKVVSTPFMDQLGGGLVTGINDPTWSFGLTASYPLFSGDSRRRQLQRTRIELLQLRDQQALLRQQLELGIRSTLETAAASFSNLELSQTAAQAAAKNFQIVQDSYSQGIANITSLIDAQNASLQTALNAENAFYQFIIDMIQVERAVGFYFILESPEERESFIERLNTFILSQN